MSQCQLGAQLYINRNDTSLQIKRWVDQMAEHGLKLVRLFMSWDLLERKQGQWDWTQFDAVFDQAEKRGLQIVPTLMSVSPPGWMRCSGGSQDVGDLDDQIFWQAGMEYIDAVVQRYAQRPSLNSWILWNEPARTLDKSNPVVLQNYRSYLNEKYDYDVGKINADYYQQVESFDQLFEENDKGKFTSALEFLSYAEDVDWLDFTVYDLEEKLRAIAERVKATDAEHPLHINPHRISQCISDSGQSIWRQAHTVDFIGSSVHPPWHSVRFPDDRIDQSVAMFSDYMRSATQDPDRKFWISELQAGPTLFSAFKSSGPRCEDLRHWIWEGIGSGAQAVMFWCFNQRNSGFEAGEWGLLNMSGQPSPRLREVQAISEDIQKNNDILSQCQPSKGVIGILVSEVNWNLSLLEGEGDSLDNPRNKQMATDAVCGAYCMASDLGYEIEFIYEGVVADTAWREHVKILLVPGCTALKKTTLVHMKNFVTEGGMLIADGLCGWKTPNGTLARQEEALSDLFGADIEDVYGLDGENRKVNNGGIIFNNNKISHTFMQIAFIDNDACLARSDDGSAAVVGKTHANNGRAIRIGTIFFQAYFMSYQSELLDIFSECIQGRVQRPLKLSQYTPGLRMRELHHPDGPVYILLNRGGGLQVGLDIDEDLIAYDEQGQKVNTEQFTVGQNEVRILALQNAAHTISSSN